MDYKEEVASNVVEGVLTIGKSRDYDLIVVGKRRFPSNMVAEQADLGPIGDILTSSAHGIVSSVLVIQQHDIAHAEEAPVSKVVVQTEYEKFTTDESSSVPKISKDFV